MARPSPSDRPRSASVGADHPHSPAWMPGLVESVPLLMFGALSVGFGAYLVVTHAPPFVGRLPLYAYLWTLGAIAIVGGLAASVVGQEMEGMPFEGETVGDDLIVVRRSQWEGDLEATPVPTPVVAPALDVAPPPPLTPRPATNAAPAQPDWWEEALEILDADHAPSPPAAASEVDDVMETLAAIERDAISTRTNRPPRSTFPRPSSDRPVPAAPSPSLPPSTWTEPLEPTVDQQLDDIDRVLDDLLVPPAGPTAPAAEASCVGCHRPADRAGRRSKCESCNRPLCGECGATSRRGRRPGLCPVCSMLLDGALGESG